MLHACIFLYVLDVSICTTILHFAHLHFQKPSSRSVPHDSLSFHFGTFSAAATKKVETESIHNESTNTHWFNTDKPTYKVFLEFWEMNRPVRIFVHFSCCSFKFLLR